MQIRVLLLAGHFKANLKGSDPYKRNLEIQLESKGLGQSSKKLWCFYSVYRDNRNITKKAFTNSGAIQGLFCMRARAKTNLKNVATGIKKENLLLIHYSRFASSEGS